MYKFNETDSNLIKTWTKDKKSWGTEKQVLYAETQMMSARGAEKFAIQFYQKLGYFVEDIFSHQLTSSTSKDWIKGDIRINSECLLDVKNTRASLNSKVYSEFCVKQLKEEREKDVRIVAVLSPYITKEEIEGDREVNINREQEIIMLGEFTKTELNGLEEIFKDRLISIDILREGDRNKYLPHWLFDCSDRFIKIKSV